MITQDTADKLLALSKVIFNSDNSVGLHTNNDSIDAQMAALIAEPMKTIDGRDLALGFKYTMNVTNALQLRPKHWYMHLNELDTTSKWPCICGLEYHSAPGFVVTGANSFGYSIGLATCAAICQAWSMIIPMWLTGNYPLAVNQP